MRILCVIGVPGVGKSTLAQEIISRLGPYKLEAHGLLKYMDFQSVTVLGVYENGSLFGGTDRLAMNVQRDAIEFLEEADKERAIMFEGDRLSNTDIINTCKRVGELRLIKLFLPEETLLARRSARSLKAGKEQNETWLKGRDSKVYHLAYQFEPESRKVETKEECSDLAVELVDWLDGFGETPVVESWKLF